MLYKCELILSTIVYIHCFRSFAIVLKLKAEGNIKRMSNILRLKTCCSNFFLYIFTRSCKIPATAQ